MTIDAPSLAYTAVDTVLHPLADKDGFTYLCNEPVETPWATGEVVRVAVFDNGADVLNRTVSPLTYEMSHDVEVAVMAAGQTDIVRRSRMAEAQRDIFDRINADLSLGIPGLLAIIDPPVATEDIAIEGAAALAAVLIPVRLQYVSMRPIG